MRDITSSEIVYLLALPVAATSLFVYLTSGVLQFSANALIPMAGPLIFAFITQDKPSVLDIVGGPITATIGLSIWAQGGFLMSPTSIGIAAGGAIGIKFLLDKIGYLWSNY